MKRIISIFLLSYYCFGTFCLPQSNFSALSEISEMYHHCKSTEDKDMTPIDFITDHLINIDSFFDKHENGDEQRPHTPIQSECAVTQTILISQVFKITFSQPPSETIGFPKYSENFCYSDFNSKIFRPPIV